MCGAPPIHRLRPLCTIETFLLSGLETARSLAMHGHLTRRCPAEFKRKDDVSRRTATIAISAGRGRNLPAP